MSEVRVQQTAELANATNTIPEEFIRSESEQPAITTVVEIPTIDLEDPDVVAAIEKASSEGGLFRVVNHGIPIHVINELQRVGREFFELPQEEKEKYAKEEGGKSIEGYGTSLQKDLARKKGWVDHLFHVIWPPSSVNYRFWPQNPVSYREANEEYARHLRLVAHKLFKCMSVGLGLEGHELATVAGDEEMEYLLKINYYPPCPRPDLALGVVAHTDMSLLTILIPNDVQGLQVFRDGFWYDVKYIPNALIIHIGDQLEIMSNGKYKAVLHRSIVNKEKTRMSWPVFLNPPPKRVIGPHPKLIGDQNPAKYKSKKYAEYVYCKLNKIPQ
ncbi:hypothetical protein V2J09_008521 [Rumex salicifolius]